MIRQYSPKGAFSLSSIAKVIPRCSLSKTTDSFMEEVEEAGDKMIRKVENDSILSYILNQIFTLKPGYLKVVCEIMEHCFCLEEEPWAFVNSSYYKLQLLFLKHGLLNFLIEHFTAIQSNDPETMLNYYNCLGHLIRSNPIMYAKLNEILLEFKSEENIQNKKKKRSQVLLFTESFARNIVASRNCVLIMLCDQIMWSYSQEEAGSENFFVEEVINRFEAEWMISLTSRVIPSLDLES